LEGEERCCPKILLIDDDEFCIYALSAKLKKVFGISSDYALNGEIAIKMAVA